MLLTGVMFSLTRTPLTRLYLPGLQVLFKMLNRGVFSEVYGCVSTGKEANVYHACTPEGTDLAIKVYKTSILVFKDRDRCEDVEIK